MIARSYPGSAFLPARTRSRLPRKRPAPEPYLANGARREHLLENRLAGRFHPAPVALVLQSYQRCPSIWGKRESQETALPFRTLLVTLSSSSPILFPPLLAHQGSWGRSVGKNQPSFTRANTWLRLGLREKNPELSRSANISYEFGSRVGCCSLPAWYFRKSWGT